jgi:asparagine synthase (glutamine-hydrolysing)
MSPTEIVCGYVFGTVEERLAAVTGPADPRQVLERVVREALLRPPCGVAFSGGRDSSAVLAVATHVARRDGLPDPVPVTKIYSGVTDADESSWQEKVVVHLGLQDWHKVVIHDELDYIGPLARHHLVEHGVLWPPPLATDVPVLEPVSGGSLIDGEGGDEVLGDAIHRIAPLARLLRHPRPLRWRRVKPALASMGPARLRRQRTRSFWNADATPWLRPAGRDVLVSALDEADRPQPRSFATSVRLVPRQRHHVLLARNRRYQARRWDVDISSPLVHPDVVEALAAQGGFLGPGDRTASLRALVPDLLPDEVLARTNKAVFTNCYMARYTQEFAAEWDGTGVDPDFVDAEALREHWIGDQRHVLTAALLQQAWLASVSNPRQFVADGG